jgi:transposase
MDRLRYNVCCGADIHKKFLIATILLLDGTKLNKRFSMDLKSLFEFRDWVIANGCEAVAVARARPTRRFRNPLNISLNHV